MSATASARSPGSAPQFAIFSIAMSTSRPWRCCARTSESKPKPTRSRSDPRDSADQLRDTLDGRCRRRRKGSTVPPVITALVTELVTEPLDISGQPGSPRDANNPLTCDDA
jgi:hypothetical protein